MNDRTTKTVLDIVRERLAHFQEVISQGKGTWPEKDYVRDAIWDGWLAIESELRWIVATAEKLPDEPPLSDSDALKIAHGLLDEGKP